MRNCDFLVKEIVLINRDYLLNSKDILLSNLLPHCTVIITKKATSPADKIQNRRFCRLPECRQYSFVGLTNQ